jgi:hypothetical protein
MSPKSPDYSQSPHVKRGRSGNGRRTSHCISRAHCCLRGSHFEASLSLSAFQSSIQQATQGSTTRLGQGSEGYTWWCVCSFCPRWPRMYSTPTRLACPVPPHVYRLLETHARALRISPTHSYLRKAAYFFSLQRAERGVGLFFCACVRVPPGQRMARLPMRCYMMVFSSAGREY